MASFDPTGSLMKGRFFRGDYINESTVNLIWQIPKVVPSTWIPNKKSPYEKQAISAIANKLGNEFIVFSNVPLSSIFSVNEDEIEKIVLLLIQECMLKYSKKEELISRCITAMKTCIGKKAVDILMCHKKSGSIYGGVEIDGVHHFKDSNQQNFDFIKSKFFQAAILPLARVNTQGLNSSNPWTLSQEEFFIRKILSYKLVLRQFQENPSIAVMQKHNPDVV